MKTSNKVLLAALGVLLALFLAFVLTMSFTIRGRLEQRGRTAQAIHYPAAAVLPERELAGLVAGPA
jgi:cell division protein FtsX